MKTSEYIEEKDNADESDFIDSVLQFGWIRRVPGIRQTEAAECGLACVAMVSGYFGRHFSMAEMRRLWPVSIKGMTLADLVQCAESVGLASRAVVLEIDELKNLAAPCILHWDLNHFVVLERVSRKAMSIHDPAVGPRKLTIAEVGKHFTGVAVEFTTASTFERKPAPLPISMRKLAGKVTGLRRAVATLLGLALVLEVFSLIVPQYLQITIDQVIADGDQDLLLFLGFTFCGVLAAQSVVSAVRTWALMWVGNQFVFNWTGNVFRHLMKLPQGYFMGRHIGDISSRFASITTIQQTLTTQLVAGSLDGFMAVVTLCVLFVYNAPMAALTLIAVLLYGGSRILYFRSLKEANLSQIVVDARRQTRFIESVRCAQTIRLANQQAITTSRYLNATADVLNTQVAVQKLGLVFETFNAVISGMQRIAVLWIGGWLGMSGHLSAGMLVAFVSYGDQFVTRATSLIDYLIQLKLLRLQGERLADIVMTTPEEFVQTDHDGVVGQATVELDNVSFRYGQGEKWVVRNGSFKVADGETVALVGPSGCGKSTILRVLTGLVDPEGGRVLVGGVDLKKLGKGKFRSMCGIVMQDDQVLSGTIADNISMFDPAADLGVVEQMARMAQLHNDIAAMPMGYNSLIGSMGSGLSGGQTQRLFLARALYKKPRMLLLDESTSHLDVATEAKINASIASLAMTKIIIAHRPETIASADRVLELRGGQITQIYPSLV